MKTSLRGFLRALSGYAGFFLLVAFVVTCSTLLFVSAMASSMDIEFTAENLGVAAKLTFGNVIFIAFLLATIDRIRKRVTVDRPVRRITAAMRQIMEGDFSVRVEPLRDIAPYEGFNRIIDGINTMASELAGTETLRTDFIANVSHELKTPLAVMDNYATMLRRPGLTGQERLEYAAAISHAARRLAQLITNILKLNKLENQQIFPKAEEFDLSEQLREVLLGFEDAWERKQLEVEADIADDVRLRSDPELLELVWSNLISNAVKFTPEGGCIRLTLVSSGQTVSVSVQDTGCGMKPETGKHIFEKFYQGDTSHSTQGNGLGLALVKRVVDILGAEITVESVWEKGSTFTVRLRRI